MKEPKSTGMIRKVDELGRIVIPIELRNLFGIVEKTEMELFVDGNRIILEKHELSCNFCGNTENLIEFKERRICQKCLEELMKSSTKK